MKNFLSIVLGTTCLLFSGCHAGEKPIPREQMVCFPDFRSVAKNSIPAVVSVKVEAHPQPQRLSSRGEMESNADDPFDAFGRDFFDRFFGVPRRGEQPSQVVQGQASGFIISPDGYILTNNHVVNGADLITIQLNDGREYIASVVGQDKNSDLAVLKIDAEEAEELPFLTLGNSEDLEVGQWVCAIGNPLGLNASLSVGIVSAKGRNNLDLVQYEDFIQTDTTINRGNSGGPLMTLDGEVIGINTAIATSGSSGFMGIGFAIPSAMAEKVMEQLIAKGSVTRGFLGIALQGIDHSLAQSFNLNRVEGALVVDVKPNSPAAEAGIQREDIILSYDGRPVQNISSFRNAISFMDPGQTVKLTVLRNDQKIQVPVTLGIFADSSASKESKGREEELGLGVEALSSEQAQQLGYANEKGLLISKVYPGSIAAKAGVKKGSLLLSVNRKPVSSPEEFYRILKGHSAEKPLLLLIKQGEGIRYITVKLQ